MIAIPADFDPVSKPLSLALGTKDSLLDNESVGKIQDLMAKKTEVPHEMRVRYAILWNRGSDWSLRADILG